MSVWDLQVVTCRTEIRTDWAHDWQTSVSPVPSILFRARIRPEEVVVLQQGSSTSNSWKLGCSEHLGSYSWRRKETQTHTQGAKRLQELVEGISSVCGEINLKKAMN